MSRTVSNAARAGGSGISGDAAGAAARFERRVSADRGGKSVMRQYAEALGLAVVVAVLLRSFVFQAFKIPSESMLPALQVGDHLLVNKLRYGFRMPILGGWLVRYADPGPGQVVVFSQPGDSTKDFIKRVAAVAGEKVEIVDKRVLIDGKPREISDAYFADGLEGPSHFGRDRFGPVVVPPGSVFVLGDNRDRSYDSRSWGFVDLADVQGEAFLIYWSWDARERSVRWERLGRLVQ